MSNHSQDQARGAPNGSGSLRSSSEMQVWQISVWVGVGLTMAAVMAALMWMLVQNLTFTQDALLSQSASNPTLMLYGMGMAASLILRLIGMVFGGALAFGGLLVSFLAHDSESTFAAEGPGVSGKLRAGSRSPGVLAVIAGCVVIVAALFAKGEHMVDNSGAGALKPPPTTVSTEPPPSELAPLASLASSGPCARCDHQKPNP